MLTQGVLLLNQVVLLPIQIRIWGHLSTAHWYAMLAIATIVSVADCGLRTAGHAELIRYAHNPADEQATAALYLYIGHDLLSEARTLAVSALGAFFNSRPEEPAND